VIKPKFNLDEETVNSLLPERVRSKARRFFTPRKIAIQAALWLSGDDHRKILDIGAGVGKFCLYGASHTKSDFVGIEMRSHLVDIAENLLEAFEIKNAKVIHGNITEFNFFEYEAFYLYNPFHENIAPILKMDDTILLSKDFYCIYIQYTRAQLALAKKGTKLVTYHGLNNEVPSSYKLVEQFANGDLKYWIKDI
jgi:16S rRNA A1518/A1519 N6-dimethyltransferase RsmA/KsgA/DIM1 with predicted DNA glycosylase/AP lyase activity